MWVVLITLHDVYAEVTPYNITKIQHSPGLFFEFIGDLQFYTEEQHLITHLNLENLDKKYLTILQYIKQTKVILSQATAINDKFQNRLIFEIESEMTRIETQRENLHQIVGHISNNKRTKRGWFNFIGVIANKFFGVMDNEDAEFIDKKLNEFDKTETVLATVIKDQSHVVRTTILNFNSTMSSLVKNEQILKEQTKYLGESMKKLSSFVQHIDLNKIVDEHINILVHFVTILRNDYDTLTTAVLLAKRGILHPSIMSPFQIRENMIKLISNIPAGLQLPIPENKENSYLILELINLVAYYYNKRLVFVVKIPLLPTQLFEIYKTTPMPTKILNNSYIFIKPSNRYFLIRKEDKFEFATMNEVDISKCKKFEDKRICLKVDPTFNSHLESNCETQLFSTVITKIPESCEVHVINLKENIWHKLTDRNSWMFVVKYPTIVTITCQNYHDPIDVTISDVGLITIKSGCKIYSGYITLESTKTFYSNIEKNFVPSFNICDFLCDDERINKVKTEIIEIKSPNLNTINLDELHLSSIKLKQMEQMAEDLLIKTKMQYRANATTYALVIMATVIISYVAYKIVFKYHRIRPIQQNQQFEMPDILQQENNIQQENPIQQQPNPVQQQPNPVQQQVRRSSRLFARRQI